MTGGGVSEYRSFLPTPLVIFQSGVEGCGFALLTHLTLLANNIIIQSVTICIHEAVLLCSVQSINTATTNVM